MMATGVERGMIVKKNGFAEWVELSQKKRSISSKS